MGFEKRRNKAPVISDEFLKSQRAEIAKINRNRSKAMERKIAKFLGGRRQPGSGSMSPFKGDCIIPLVHHKGHYLIECKSSASLHKDRYHRIRLQFPWLTKLEKDRTAMECLFGVFIIHYHNQINDYVLFAVKDIERLKKWFSVDHNEFLQKARELPIAIDMCLMANGTVRKGFELYKYQIDRAMQPIDNIKVAKIRNPIGDYIILRIEDFRDIIADL